MAIPRFLALLTDSLQVKSAKELPLNASQELFFFNSPVFQKKATRRFGQSLAEAHDVPLERLLILRKRA